MKREFKYYYHKCILIFIFNLVGCNTSNKEEIKEDKLDNYYKLIKYSNVSHFRYNQENKNIKSETTDDLLFSKELLYSLDSSLTGFNYDITICDERIQTNLNDTIDIIIYDFINSENKNEIKAILKDTMVADKFISLYEAPIISRFFLNKENLCFICMRRMEFLANTNNEYFINYIKQTTQQRLNRR